MKSPLPALAAELLADATLMAILGGEKVYIHEIAQGTARPAILMYEVSGSPLGETLQATTEPWQRRISVDCQGANPKQADEIADRVLAILNNRSGVIGDLHVQYCRVVSGVVQYEDTIRIPQRILDFRIVYGRA